MNRSARTPARSLLLLPLLLCALALAACQDEPSVLRLVIDTDGDIEVPDELDRIELTLTASRTEAGDFCEPASRGFNLSSTELPLPIFVEAGDEYTSWVLFRVVGLLEGVEIVRVEGTMRWLGPGTYDYDVVFDHECLELACIPGELCVEGDCEVSQYADFIDDHAYHDEETPCSAGDGTTE